jgi:hypothetical protein
MQVWQSRFTAEESAAAATLQQSGPTILEVRTSGLNPDLTKALTRRLDPAITAFVAEPASRGVGIVRAPCQLLQRLGAVTCPDGATPLTEVFPNPGPQIRTLQDWFLELSASRWKVQNIDQAAPANDHSRLFLFNPHGARGLEEVKRAAYATYGSAIVDRPGEAWLGGAAYRSALTSWVLLVGLAGLLVLALTGALVAAGTFVQQARTLGPLATFTADRSFYRRVAAVNVTLPLLVAVCVGVVVAAWLGALHVGAADEGAFSMVILAISAGAGTLVAVAAGLFASETAARAVAAWRPQGD